MQGWSSAATRVPSCHWHCHNSRHLADRHPHSRISHRRRRRPRVAAATSGRFRALRFLVHLGAVLVAAAADHSCRHRGAQPVSHHPHPVERAAVVGRARKPDTAHLVRSSHGLGRTPPLARPGATHGSHRATTGAVSPARSGNVSRSRAQRRRHHPSRLVRAVRPRSESRTLRGHADGLEHGRAGGLRCGCGRTDRRALGDDVAHGASPQLHAGPGRAADFSLASASLPRRNGREISIISSRNGPIFPGIRR